eukprot:jgi/Ulvmu1/9061/UM005_0154.1
MPAWDGTPQTGSSEVAAKTRQQLLEQAHADRDARKTERLRHQSAVYIQCCWRGYQARVVALRTICQQIVKAFRKAVPAARPGGDANDVVPASQLLHGIVVRLAVACNEHRDGRVYARRIPSVCKTDVQGALSTALALTIRSLTSASEAESLLRLCPSEASTAAWAWPSFALLCARAADVQFSGNEALAAAAARCVYLLLTSPAAAPPINGHSRPNQNEDLPQSTAIILSRSSGLFNAASASLKCEVSAAPDIEYPSATAMPSTATMHERLQANLLRSLAAVFDLLSCDSVDMEDHIAATAPGTPLAAACGHTISFLLTSPAVLTHYAAINAALGSSKRQLLLSLLVYLAGAPEAPAADPHATVFALTATTVLLVGPKAAVPGATAHALSTLQPCALMRDPLVARALLCASARVLAAARSTGQPRSAAQRHLLQLQAWPFTQNVFLLDLLQASKADMSCWAPPETGGDGGSWDGMDAVVCTYHAWIQIAANAPVRSDAFVSLLAYHAPWMRMLWRRVATRCVLPLEAPADAVRGADVPSLHGGAEALSPPQIAALHLFCALLSHLLVVLDDEAFHSGADSLPLPALRAAALSLNSLVFHSCMHKRAALQPQRAQRALLALAGTCLQQLHSRHVRRPYCPEAAWLAPWTAWSETAGQKAEETLTGAVLRVMLARAEEEDGDASTAREANGPAGAIVELLQTAPHSVPYALRVGMFRQLLTMDKEGNAWVAGQGRVGMKVKVKRGRELEDAYAQLGPLGSRIKQPLMVTFVDEHGANEAGIDQGGLLKELLENILAQGFDAGYGLVSFTADGKAFPSPLAHRVPGGLSMLEFLGLSVAKALYEGLLLDIELASLFVMALQRRHPALEDLFTLDADLYRSLIQIKDYSGSASDLGLYFVVEEDVLGRTVEHELLPAGGEVPVTDSNKLMYVYLCAHWHMARINSAAAQAFSAGLSRVIPISFLCMFTVVEVNELLGGAAAVDGISVADMQAHCHYKGGYSRSSSTVRMFWRVVAGFTAEEQRLLLKFVTGTRRAPLGGFANLTPPLVLYKVDCGASPLARLGGADVDRLPTASTCFSLLKLPNYRRSSTLRKKLLYAITAKAGFDLS